MIVDKTKRRFAHHDYKPQLAKQLDDGEMKNVCRFKTTTQTGNSQVGCAHLFAHTRDVGTMPSIRVRAAKTCGANPTRANYPKCKGVVSFKDIAA